MSWGEAISLQHQVQKLYEDYGATEDIEVQLPLTVLMEFHKRMAGAITFKQPEIKIYLKRAEALAFQVLYMGSMIDTTSETRQIAHAIDTTL